MSKQVRRERAGRREKLAYRVPRAAAARMAAIETPKALLEKAKRP
jgi:hypothetical protein